MQIRQLTISRYRGIRELSFEPGKRTVILGPQNAGKSTVPEALDLLLHHGLGRPRQPPTEIDYYGRSPEEGFEISAILGDLSEEFAASVREHLEGWNAEAKETVAELDGPDVEPVVRVRLRGTPDLSYEQGFVKPESEGARSISDSPESQLRPECGASARKANFSAPGIKTSVRVPLIFVSDAARTSMQRKGGPS